MSVCNEDEALKPHLDKIIEGMEGFAEAAKRRLNSGEWNEVHRENLGRLLVKMVDLEIQFRILRQDTW